MTMRTNLIPTWSCRRGATALGLTLLLYACSGSDMPADSYPGCDKATLEPDFMPTPLAGQGVSPQGVLGPPASGSAYVVSTTYLSLSPDAGPRFGQLLGPVMERLKTQKGIAALSWGQSAQCSSARTLVVWTDIASMYDFVASPEHSAAAAAVTQISRGNSAVSHRQESDPQKAGSWSAVAQALAGAELPLY